MKKISVIKECDDFFNYLQWHANLTNKILENKSSIFHIAEQREIIEGLVFQIDAMWTIFTKRTMYYCLSFDTSRYSQFHDVKLKKQISFDLARVLLNGSNYLDFRSVDDIKTSSKKILTDKCNPFILISGPNRTIIDEFYTIRNFITHRSSFQHRKLFHVYKKHKLTKFVQPGSFLLALKPKSTQPRLGFYINAFNDAASEMHTLLSKV